jgi:hypothetical protein
MDELDNEFGFDPLDNVHGIANVKEIGRPTFLSVLCILAFIGNGLGILQGLFIWMMSGFYARLFTGLSNSLNTGKSEMRIVEKVLNGLSWWAISIVIGSLICLAGAIIMWRLKKSGYLLYILGQILPLLGVLFFFLGAIPGPSSGGSMIFVLFSSILPIAFIVMFGLNQKYLK